MRITNEEMVDAFLKGRGLHKDKPDVSVGLILPFLLLDPIRYSERAYGRYRQGS